MILVVTDDLDLRSLATQAGVTPRTVHYYIQQGLLPPPDGAGRAARYGAGHLARLRLIRRLQREHLPLSEIRRQLDALSDDEIQGSVEAPSVAPRSSARDYVRSLLAGQAPDDAFSARSPSQAAMPTPRLGRIVETRMDPWPSRSGADRSQWDRITLAEDVELHIRRPLARERNRQVDKLIGLARELFREDAP